MRNMCVIALWIGDIKNQNNLDWNRVMVIAAKTCEFYSNIMKNLDTIDAVMIAKQEKLFKIR